MNIEDCGTACLPPCAGPGSTAKRSGANSELAGWLDCRVIHAHGAPVGVGGRLDIDLATGHRSWVAISSGLFGACVVVAPVPGASLLGDDVMVANPRNAVVNAPGVHPAMSMDHQLLVDHHARWCNSRPGNPTERQRP